ncbi:Hpt domain-containing protein [Bradyrhizobium roseum]|uniref:Hpt domain-containing protein n=1 Tax=Bradyrhizobium roseum TaxID=3056648 RepID=UPI00261126BD|nr:Hpt domain-containing protein [Bradyrhizobium roseus]WKA29938.1 Hpt domain-containing protein [Bradyrhizobium roseus]
MTQSFSFDEAVFRELGSELGADDLVALLNVFLADTAKKLVRIEAQDQTRAVIKREAHSMKSSAATFGFRVLSQTARQLEAGAEDMPQAALQASIGELRLAFEATRVFADRNLLQGTSGAAA